MARKNVVLALGMLMIAPFWIGCANDSANGEARFSNWMEDSSGGKAGADKADPKLLPVTYFAAGKLFEKRGQHEQAAQKYQQAVAANRQFIAGYNRLGIVLDRLGRYEAADDAFIRAIEIAPDKAYLRNNLAFSYILQRRYDDAEAELINALQLQQDFKRANVNLGLVYARQEKFNAALDQFARALPRPDAYYNLGMIFASMGRYQDAANLYRLALEMQPRMSAAGTQLERLAHRLAEPSPGEPQAIITHDGIVPIRIDHRPFTPFTPTPAAETAVARAPAGTPSKRADAIAGPVEEEPVVAQGSPLDADSPARLNDGDFAEEEEFIEEDAFIEDRTETAPTKAPADEPADQAATGSAKGVDGTSKRRISTNGAMVIASADGAPGPSTDASDTARDEAHGQGETADEKSPEASSGSVNETPIGGPIVSFEHNRPDFVGQSPAVQRKVFQKLASLARENLAGIGRRIQDELEKVESQAGTVVLQFEHDRPDYTRPALVDRQEKFVRNLLDSVGIPTVEPGQADPETQSAGRLSLDPGRSEDPDWVDPRFPAGQSLDEE